MTDRELLELAAKAAGIDGRWHVATTSYAAPTGWLKSDGNTWNPLTDDGNALRLAVKCRIDVEFFRHEPETVDATSPLGDYKGATELIGDDPCAATRRAIVRAAAEIGRAM